LKRTLSPRLNWLAIASAPMMRRARGVPGRHYHRQSGNRWSKLGKSPRFCTSEKPLCAALRLPAARAVVPGPTLN
jgi:hypothetical protein